MKNSSKVRVLIYRDPATESVNWEEIAGYLKEKLNCKPQIRGPLFEKIENAEQLAAKFAAARVHDPLKPPSNQQPLPAEIQVELKLLGQRKEILGVLYDGIKLQKICLDFLPSEEKTVRHIHIVFLNRLIGTFENDGRYHVHAAVFGFPTLISIQGVVFGPARPREYYTMRRWLSEEEIYKRLEKRFLVLGDPRLTQILKGYLMQAVLYHLGENPFCNDKKCRLYNARWQEELLTAQLEQPEFCERHVHVIKNLQTKYFGSG
jgi:hypothetical protein